MAFARRGRSWAFTCNAESVSAFLPSTGSVEVALARPVAAVPERVAGQLALEPKWDGWRGLLRVGPAARAELWSRQHVDLGARFPEILAAARAQLPGGTVLDGELVCWFGGRLSWDQLQRRLGSPARVAEQVRVAPASYVAFDVLALRGDDVREQPWLRRRVLLEQLGATLKPPLQVTPVTLDPLEAEQWARDLQPQGFEGLVIKNVRSRYVAGRSSSWLKWKVRQTEEVIIGAVTGSHRRPEAVILGRLTPRGVLAIMGRSSRLDDLQAIQVSEAITAAGASGHPWPPQIGNPFGGPPIVLQHVDPVLVAEVSADSAVQGGRWRHSVRFERLRPDLSIGDVPLFST